MKPGFKFERTKNLNQEYKKIFDLMTQLSELERKIPKKNTGKSESVRTSLDELVKAIELVSYRKYIQRSTSPMDPNMEFNNQFLDSVETRSLDIVKIFRFFDSLAEEFKKEGEALQKEYLNIKRELELKIQQLKN